MTSQQALAFVEANGIVLESARGPAPSLAELIAGENIRGSWWRHRKAPQIFQCSRAIRESKDVLVCRLLEGKVTYVHPGLGAARCIYGSSHVNLSESRGNIALTIGNETGALATR